MPIIVTGTSDSPHFAPDVGEIARMKLPNLVPRFGNPGGVTSGILGFLLGGDKKGGPQQQQDRPGGYLGALRGEGNTNPAETSNSRRRPLIFSSRSDNRRNRPIRWAPVPELGDEGQKRRSSGRNRPTAVTAAAAVALASCVSSD